MSRHTTQARPRAEADAILETALAETDLLTTSQAGNIRAKVEDLVRGRLVWESVPFRVILESNRRCNLACTMCDNVHTGNGDLAADLVERLYDQIGPGAVEIQPFGAGEPTLAPIDQLAPLARRHNQYFNFITNGVLFTRAYHEAIADRVARVQFSIHSHRAEVGNRITASTDHAEVMANLEDAVTLGQQTGTHVLAGMVVMDDNLDELPDYVRFMGDRGVRRILFSRLYPTSSVYAELGIERRRSQEAIDAIAATALDVALEYGIYLETNIESIVTDPRNRPHQRSRFDLLHENAHIVELYRPEFCISTAITIFVEWDGTVLPCFQHRIPLGNLYEQSFDEIWNGPAMQRHRDRFFRRDLEDFCARCQRFFCDHA